MPIPPRKYENVANVPTHPKTLIMTLYMTVKTPLGMINTPGANRIVTLMVSVLITVPQTIMREITHLHHQIQPLTYPSVSMSTGGPYLNREGTPW